MKKSNAPAGARTPFQKWVDKYQGLFYLIPWIIGFLVFKAFPFGQSLYYSFTDMNFFKDGTSFVGLANYITAFHTKKITKALIITFKYAFITVPLKLIFALHPLHSGRLCGYRCAVEGCVQRGRSAEHRGARCHLWCGAGPRVAV